MEKMKSFQEDIMLSDRSKLDKKYFHKSHKGKKLSVLETTYSNQNGLRVR